MRFGILIIAWLHVDEFLSNLWQEPFLLLVLESPLPSRETWLGGVYSWANFCFETWAGILQFLYNLLGYLFNLQLDRHFLILIIYPWNKWNSKFKKVLYSGPRPVLPSVEAKLCFYQLIIWSWEWPFSGRLDVW